MQYCPPNLINRRSTEFYIIPFKLLNIMYWLMLALSTNRQLMQWGVLVGYLKNHLKARARSSFLWERSAFMISLIVIGENCKIKSQGCFPWVVTIDWLEGVGVLLGGWYPWELMVSVCCTALQISLTYFQTKICHLLYPLWCLTSKIHAQDSLSGVTLFGLQSISFAFFSILDMGWVSRLVQICYWQL